MLHIGFPGILCAAPLWVWATTIMPHKFTFQHQPIVILYHSQLFGNLYTASLSCSPKFTDEVTELLLCSPKILAQGTVLLPIE